MGSRSYFAASGSKDLDICSLSLCCPTYKRGRMGLSLRSLVMEAPLEFSSPFCLYYRRYYRWVRHFILYSTIF